MFIRCIHNTSLTFRLGQLVSSVPRYLGIFIDGSLKSRGSDCIVRSCTKFHSSVILSIEFATTKGLLTT